MDTMDARPMVLGWDSNKMAKRPKIQLGAAAVYIWDATARKKFRVSSLSSRNCQR